MDSKIFEIVDENTKRVLDRVSWDNLAKQHPEWKYSGGVSLRSAWRKETARREQNKVNKATESSAKAYPKIAIFDIENTPLLLYSFSLWNENISPDHIMQDSYLISWSAKLLNEPKIYGQVLTPEEAKDNDDSRIVKGIWEFLSGCQILIGHNVRGFDLPKLNVRFLHHNLPPIANVQIIDTLAVAKQQFAFTSNSLRYLARFLGVTNKIENEGMSLWVNCMKGNPDALQEMFSYNNGDVVTGEDVYFKLRGFIKGHPNLALYNEIDAMQCPNCGGVDLVDQGWYFTSTGKYQSLRCNSCGAVSRKRKDEVGKDKKKVLLRN